MKTKKKWEFELSIFAFAMSMISLILWVVAWIKIFLFE